MYEILIYLWIGAAAAFGAQLIQIKAAKVDQRVDDFSLTDHILIVALWPIFVTYVSWSLSKIIINQFIETKRNK
jgi:hypothetical protein